MQNNVSKFIDGFERLENVSFDVNRMYPTYIVQTGPPVMNSHPGRWLRQTRCAPCSLIIYEISVDFIK